MIKDYPPRIIVSVDALSAEARFTLYDNAPNLNLNPEEIFEQIETEAHEHGMSVHDYIDIYRNNH